jgi:hypothetical protein
VSSVVGKEVIFYLISNKNYLNEPSGGQTVSSAPHESVINQVTL